MTQRSELQHRRLELQAKAMNWVANRLLSLKEDGVDGFLKRRFLPAARRGGAKDRAQS